jgi:tetratricopeptide (TPR) repeat protein
MKTCFVVQGFGKKTDFTDGRVLDLDASYAIIKEAVLACGLRCLRADEIEHSGTIDVPMYEQLLRADLVIADLSTYNVNAAFELGVRYALRPHATLIVAEEQLKNPFDFSHLVMRRYKHLGEDIGAKEARRFSTDLQQAIRAILATPQTDSPIYTFFPQLQPPQERIEEEARQAHEAALRMAEVGQTLRAASEQTLAVPSAVPDARNTRELLDTAQSLITAGQALPARALLEEVHRRYPHDADVTLRLGQATALSAQPNVEAALHAACEVLRELDPDNTNNPETLALWGDLHYQLWHITPSREYLDESVQAHERGFLLKQDPDIGVQLALLLDTRALAWLEDHEPDDALTDHTLAQRVRRELCRWAPARLDQIAKDAPTLRYHLLCALWLCALALADEVDMQRWEREMTPLQVSTETHQRRHAQGEQLQELLRRYQELQALQPTAPL